EQRLLLYRDRLGVKPLYLARTRSRLAIASEIKGLLAVPGIDRTPDYGIVRDYLLNEIVDHSARTFFTAIRALPAGHNLVIDRTGEHLDAYWTPGLEPHQLEEVGDRSRTDDLRELLIDSVALQLRSDVAL